MIHYHGVPITPNSACAVSLAGKHAFVSYAHPEQLNVVIEVCQSFACDNGAFPAWKSGNPILDWQPYYDFIKNVSRLPSFDFAVVPDVIDGTEQENDKLIEDWPFPAHMSAPVWHMHESIERLVKLATNWPRICIGSSGDFSKVGTKNWWNRMSEAMDAICDEDGYPICKIHGMRMLSPKVFSNLPFTSVDATTVGRNIGIDKVWTGSKQPPDKEWRAKILIARIEAHNGAPMWLRDDKTDLSCVNLESIGIV